ncbi:YadA C-terminal domain-containing protein [Rahnella inusitata]|uniref:YadA C-terminal domain-containing protein n=1 Tax=Rahnella inusitata TaxID=58169 RepID=UPI000DD307D2|nr:YadA C-terminal domain-containing protein [Rahnella inusitata]
MKAQLTERNTQIIAAYIAGNTNKIELAHYFGVSASTIRRVLAGFAMAVAMVPLAQASLLDDVNNGISFQEFTAKWESMTLSQQQTERALLRAAGEENILQDLRDNVAIHAPDAIPQATPQLSPQAIPQAIPQATPQLTPVAPVQTVQLTPQAIPQATPQLTPVAPVQTAQATPQAAPHATPEKIPSREPVHPDGQHFTSEPQAHLDGKHNVEINPGHANPEGTPVDNRAIAQRQLTADKYISASRQTVAETTATPAQQPVIPQQVRSAYYDKQITALNAEAEQNHAEVLAESHSRAVGDAQTLSQANDYTNKRFSDLKSQVDDNKDQANAGTASALAATGIPQVEAGSDFMVGAGAGTYGNQSAIAVGVSGHLTAKTVTKLAVSGDTNNGFGASAGIGWNF